MFSNMVNIENNFKFLQKSVDIRYSMVYNEYVNKERELQKSSSKVNENGSYC